VRGSRYGGKREEDGASSSLAFEAMGLVEREKRKWKKNDENHEFVFKEKSLSLSIFSLHSFLPPLFLLLSSSACSAGLTSVPCSPSMYVK
jgi:hypothetical protein